MKGFAPAATTTSFASTSSPRVRFTSRTIASRSSAMPADGV